MKEDLSDSENEENEKHFSVLHRFRGNWCQSRFSGTPNQKFLPDADAVLEQALNSNNVARMMQCSQDDPAVIFSLTRARKLFTISGLVLKNSWRKQYLYKAMRLFEAAEVDDDALPAHCRDFAIDEMFKSKLDNFFDDNSNMDANTILRNKIWSRRNDWDDDNLTKFCKEQWYFLAPVLTNKRLHVDIDPWMPMPFTKGEYQSQGAFGEVWRYELHPRHLGDTWFASKSSAGQSKSLAVAVKELVPRREEERHGAHTLWKREANNLAKVSKLEHDHIVHFIAAFRRIRAPESHYNEVSVSPQGQDVDTSASDDADGYFLVFEWADGGNLLKLWEKIEPDDDPYFVQDVFAQLRGLTQALQLCHNPENSGLDNHYRHGDLKPENILWFRHGGRVGTLKITDWGISKGHNLSTEHRPDVTSTEWGSRRYAPPEDGKKARSRLYDVWSLGIIFLEFVVWLQRGRDGLNAFRIASRDRPFHVTDSFTKQTTVHTDATRLMEELAKGIRQVHKGPTAIDSLLEIVRDHLIVVPIRRNAHRDSRTNTGLGSDDSINAMDEEGLDAGDDLEVPTVTLTRADTIEVIASPDTMALDTDLRTRMTAEELEQALLTIQSRTNIDFWRLGKSQTQRGHNSSVASLGVPVLETIDYEHPTLDFEWHFVENSTARRNYNHLDAHTAVTTHVSSIDSHDFCVRCGPTRENPWTAFPIFFKVADLQQSCLQCNLCALFWKTCQAHGGDSHESVQFDLKGSLIRMNGGSPPVLTLLESSQESGNTLRRHFPHLVQVASESHLSILRQWLDECDQDHASIRPIANRQMMAKDARTFPTRLIDVRATGDYEVRLCLTETEEQGGLRWAALSHRWGLPPHYSTNLDNIEQHTKGMKLQDLPATFRDAVIVTRALGLHYIWIDSLCIIQGEGGDFNQEAKRMLEIYSGAYCVLAASNATSHHAGFLRPRQARDCVTLIPYGSRKDSISICGMTDDFQRHVLDAEMYHRGWILQEHALARRTIFFTDHQMYFECGDGVRCETGAKMSNSRAKFLGDPNFPQILIEATHGERILRYQELYKTYSRLKLANRLDRPLAIDGLQRRLIQTMGVQGDFGILESSETLGMLRRSLLWYRGDDTPYLDRIIFPDERGVSKPPSWSWMAYYWGEEVSIEISEGQKATFHNYSGGIDYLDLQFDGVDWEYVSSPWSSSRLANDISRSDASMRKAVLTTRACRYFASPETVAKGYQETRLIFDNPGGTGPPNTLCVVLGIQKGTMAKDAKRHFVLLISAYRGKTPQQQHDVYERVGAGYMPGRCIDTVSSVPVNII